jgi:peptidoglycan hydrolase CwlO-like protein
VNDLEVLLTNVDHDYSKQRDEVESLMVELNDLRSERDSLNVDMESKEAEILLLNDRIGDLSNQFGTASV